jgi:ketosteroid isomerase-like protein
MSQADVDLVKVWAEQLVGWFALNEAERPQRAIELTERYVAPDAVYEEDPVWPDADTYRGREAIRDRFLEYVDLLQMPGVEVGEIRDAGDVVLAEFRIKMLQSETGQSFEFLWTYTFRIEDGQIVHWRAWADGDAARAATGLVPG